ncbi:MAG: cytochrome C oxidase subunit IV family protein [Opitutales bacterium]
MSHAAPDAPLSPAGPKTIREENRKYHAFINLGLFLAVLTGIEIVIIFFPWNAMLILWGLILLSVIKFAAVITWFMHLIYDRVLLTFFFLAGLIIATGTVIALMLLFSDREVDFEVISPDLLEGSALMLPADNDRHAA